MLHTDATTNLADTPDGVAVGPQGDDLFSIEVKSHGDAAWETLQERTSREENELNVAAELEARDEAWGGGDDPLCTEEPARPDAREIRQNAVEDVLQRKQDWITQCQMHTLMTDTPVRSARACTRLPCCLLAAEFQARAHGQHEEAAEFALDDARAFVRSCVRAFAVFFVCVCVVVVVVCVSCTAVLRASCLQTGESTDRETCGPRRSEFAVPEEDGALLEAVRAAVKRSLADHLVRRAP